MTERLELVEWPSAPEDQRRHLAERHDLTGETIALVPTPYLGHGHNDEHDPAMVDGDLPDHRHS